MKNTSFKNIRHERGYKTLKQDKIGKIQTASIFSRQLSRVVVSVHASQKCELLSSVLASWPWL